MFADSSARDCARTSPVFVVAIAIFAGSLFFATPASAVTPEQLLEVLRKKGVINDEEYAILSGKKNAGAAAVPASAPPVAAAKEEPKTPAIISRYDRHNFTRRSVVQPRLVEIGAASPWPS